MVLKNSDTKQEVELEDIRRRAIERISKLKNLSFNINAADPNNEFETVPAYLRRNAESLQNSIAEVESFYTNQRAKNEDHDRTIINSANTYVNSKKSDNYADDHSEQVLIYLPASEVDLMDAERLTNACGEFMEALEFELEAENEPILGSFFQKLWFKVKKGGRVGQTELAEDFAKGKKALELKYVELPTAEQTEKLANSAAKIVEILDKQDEGIVRLGALIVLKKQVDGKGQIFVQQLNFELISIFDKNPKLLLSLQTTYELLTGDVRAANYLDEAGPEVSSMQQP